MMIAALEVSDLIFVSADPSGRLRVRIRSASPQRPVTVPRTEFDFRLATVVNTVSYASCMRCWTGHASSRLSRPSLRAR